MPDIPSFAAVRAAISEVYASIWSEWYDVRSGVTRATLEITQSDSSAGYIHSENLIRLSVPEGNLDDPDILDKNGWPIWKIELIHEMLHEWQRKKPCQPTADADVLFERFRCCFSGEGHGPTFFQAIVEKAPYFGMTPEEIVGKL